MRRRTVAVNEARRMLADGDAVLLDVRTKQERKEAHVPGSIHISLESLEGQVRRVPTETVVLTFCRSGSRSGTAARILRAHGIDARNVRGGMLAWRRAGGDVR